MKETTRIAQVLGKMVGGGVEQVVMNYYRHVNRDRVQFDFLVDADSTLVPRDEIESLGGQVFVIPPYQNVTAYHRELVRLFRQEGWPVVHSHVNALSLFPLRAAKKAGVPVRIAHSHSTSGGGEFARNAIKAALKPLSNVYPTHRMACSRYAGEWLFGKRADFEVLYNAIDLPRFSFDDGVRAQVRADLGLSAGQLVILHVGRFMEQKNHRFLINVFEEVVRRRPDAILLLVGDGELRASVERRVNSLGLSERVLFLGQRSDVNRFYSAADAFVLPSLYEGLGIVAVEAQRAGLPCLLSSVISPEVNVTESVGFLPIGDPVPWADALCSVEPGKRVEVRDDEFANYDIESAGLRLTERYLGLAGEVGRGGE